jgi:DNA-binding NtrC family response regulator
MSRVLVVDDQNHLCSAFAMVLRIKGFEVVVAESDEAGLQGLEDSNCDLVVIDIFLQHGMGGIELFRCDGSTTLCAYHRDIGLAALEFAASRAQ